MNKSCIILLLLFIIKNGAAQLPELQWVKAFYPPPTSNYRDYNNGRSVAIDQQGNVYSTGLFAHTLDFDPGPGVFNLTASNNTTAIYISKLNAKGDFIWAIQIPTLVEFANIEIEVDKLGNVYLASVLPDPADMDPGPGISMLTPIGAKDAFVAKYDTDGKFIWAKQFGGPGDTVPYADDLEIDKNDNIIIVGGFNNTVDFDPGPNTFNLTSTAHIQSYIAKLNSNGDFIWAKQFGNSNVVYSGASISDVKCDLLGNIYIVGGFKGACDFDPGNSTYIFQSTSLSDGFLSKLDPNGNFIWAKQIGNTTNDYYQYIRMGGIGLDSKNNIYTTGVFIGTVDFDPGANTHTITGNGYDWYILKLDQQGVFVRADIFGGAGIDAGGDITVDNEDNVYAVGSIGNIADMDPGSGVYTITSTFQYGAGVLTKLNSNGGLIYAVPFQGNGSFSGRRMKVDAAKNIYFAGSVSGNVDFDPGPNTYNLSSAGDESPIVLKLIKCKNPTDTTLNINECYSYTLNNEIFDSSGIYYRTIQNAAGCDSNITLHLTINKKFSQQTKDICQGESFFTGNTNQTKSGIYKDTLKTWLNCDSIVTTYLTVHPNPIPDLGQDRNLCMGAQATITPGSFTKYQWQDQSSANSFTVNAPGTYWVKVTNNFNCSATDTFIVHSILPHPSNFLKNTDSICEYATLKIEPIKTFNQYVWSTGSSEKIIEINKPGKYLLKVTDQNGCAGTDSMTVFKKDCMLGVYIPTAFTPNNDGKNDYFKALVFGKVLSFKLEIFDRAGQIIFQTTDPDKVWDGGNKLDKYPTAVFVWQCSYHLDKQLPGYQKGTVTIIR